MSETDNDASWSPMVPELACAEFAASLAFYTDHLGFRVRYERIGFAYLEFSLAPPGRPVQLMLEQAGDHWSTGALEAPFGRGINLQIETIGVEALHARLVSAGIALFRDIDLAWYRDGAIEHGVRQFLVQDPSGYLLRFMEPVGTRPAT